MPQWPKLLEQHDHKENSQTSFSFVPNEALPEAEPSDSQTATITNKNDILGRDFMNTEKGKTPSWHFDKRGGLVEVLCQNVWDKRIIDCL